MRACPPERENERENIPQVHAAPINGGRARAQQRGGGVRNGKEQSEGRRAHHLLVTSAEQIVEHPARELFVERFETQRLRLLEHVLVSLRVLKLILVDVAVARVELRQDIRVQRLQHVVR